MFPIFLVAHDDRWKDNYNEIEKTLTGLLSDQPIVRISHIGSTAVQGIWAKNIVDVMIEIPQNADMKDLAQILEQNGFIIMSSEANRISFNKGYTENGFADKVYAKTEFNDANYQKFIDYVANETGVDRERFNSSFEIDSD